MNGDLALNGTVTSYPQYLQATTAARRVQGVTNGHDHLMVICRTEGADVIDLVHDALTGTG